MAEIIVTADLGRFKAYRLRKDPLGMESDRMELISSFEAIEGREKPSMRSSDAPGSFKRGKASMHGHSAGSGERHSANIETRRKLLRETAAQIERILALEGYGEWHLAAGRDINATLITCLPPKLRVSLGRNIKSDLTQLDKIELMQRFETS